jgi:hypothetical protein
MTYSVKTLADEMFDYAEELVRLVHQQNRKDFISDEVLKVAGRMKKTANQSTL